MELLLELMLTAGRWVSSHLTTVSLMIVATLLVVCGGLINGFVRSLVAPFHFVLRVSAFVLLCAFGYGLITVVLIPWVAKGLTLVPIHFLFPTVLGVFVALGVVAERKRV